jgi:hypothetical protein
MHRLHVLRDGPVGGQATQAGLPCVEVPVDKARQNDLLRRVDNLRVSLDTSGYRYDTIVLYKNIRPSYLADGRIHTHNMATFDHYSTHRNSLLRVIFAVILALLEFAATSVSQV